jgi:Rap1a immunity proteins
MRGSAVSVALLLMIASEAKCAPIQTTASTNGNVLYQWCLGQNTIACVAYISGAVDTMAGGYPVFGGYRACVPVGVTYTQMQDIVMKYLQDHPEVRLTVAANLVAASVALAFPCAE